MITRRPRASGVRIAAPARDDAPPAEVIALVAALRRAGQDGDRARFDRLFEHVFARLYTWACRQSGGEKARAERLAETEIVRLTVEAEEAEAG